MFFGSSYFIGVSERGFKTPCSGSTITGVFPDSLQSEFPLNSKLRDSFSLFFNITVFVVVKPTSEFLIIRMVGTKITSGSRTKPTTSKFITKLCMGIMNFH